MKKERLTIEDRMLIENLLKENYKLKDIARIVEVQPSTISREIKRRRKSNKLTLACEKTDRFPFVCQGCSKKTYCHKKKYYYNFREAQKDYALCLIGFRQFDFFRHLNKNKTITEVK